MVKEKKNLVVFGAGVRAEKKNELFPNSSYLVDSDNNPSITIEQIKKEYGEKGDGTVYLCGHGSQAKNEGESHEISLLKDQPNTAEAIREIQKATGAKEFVVNACYVGQLRKDLERGNVVLEEGTKIVVLGSSKHTVNMERNSYFLASIKKSIDEGASIEDAFFGLCQNVGQTVQYIEVGENGKVNSAKRSSREKNSKIEIKPSDKNSDFVERISKGSKLLEEQGDKVSRVNNAFVEAMSRKEYQRAVYWLQNGVDLNALDDVSGFSPLHWAILNGKSQQCDIELVKILIELGADVNQECNNSALNNSSPLHLAIASKDAELVKIFVESGADIYQARKDGLTPFAKMQREGQDKNSEIYKIINGQHNKIDSLFDAVLSNDTNKVKGALASGVNINSKNEKGYTVLHYAVMGGNVELVKFLVENGADIHQKSRDGLTLDKILEKDDKINEQKKSEIRDALKGEEEEVGKSFESTQKSLVASVKKSDDLNREFSEKSDLLMNCIKIRNQNGRTPLYESILSGAISNDAAAKLFRLEVDSFDSIYSKSGVKIDGDLKNPVEDGKGKEPEVKKDDPANLMMTPEIQEQISRLNKAEKLIGKLRNRDDQDKLGRENDIKNIVGAISGLKPENIGGLKLSEKEAIKIQKGIARYSESTPPVHGAKSPDKTEKLVDIIDLAAGGDDALIKFANAFKKAYYKDNGEAKSLTEIAASLNGVPEAYRKIMAGSSFVREGQFAGEAELTLKAIKKVFEEEQNKKIDKIVKEAQDNGTAYQLNEDKSSHDKPVKNKDGKEVYVYVWDHPLEKHKGDPNYQITQVVDKNTGEMTTTVGEKASAKIYEKAKDGKPAQVRQFEGEREVARNRGVVELDKATKQVQQEKTQGQGRA